MKPSLEDERRALLEQIEASRAVYRRMLAGDDAGPTPVVPSERSVRRAQGDAGRGRAVQWMMDHPLWVAGGVALLVLVAPRVLGAGTQAARRRKQAKRRERERERASGGGTARALVTAAALLLRDPARMRAAIRYGQMAWGWIREKRNAKASTTAKTITTVTPDTRVTTRLH